MILIRDINKIRKFKKPVVAMGVFDGLHSAHQKILKEAVKKARRIKGTPIALTFWPHPQREASIYSLEHRLRLINKLGIAVSIVVNFNKSFSKISAVSFIKDILVKKIGVWYVYVGNNFRFGKAASGDLRMLKAMGRVYNFKTRAFRVLRINKKIISSTYIRSLIIKGKLGAAEKLLMRRVSVLGTVIKGVSLGRHLGFPTANINPHHEVLPPSGIYAVRIIYKERKFKGLCYIGTKPTIPGNKLRKINIEVYIFDFNKNIYGQYLEIQFIKKIRKDKKFPSLEALIDQIKKDVLYARKHA